jgi:hypothetical protein
MQLPAVVVKLLLWSSRGGPMTAGARARAAIAAANKTNTITATQALDGHVTLDLECLDRIYLNGYVPNLQVGGQVVTFLTQHLGNPIPSPALFNPIGQRFRAAVARFAADNDLPVVRFGKADRKIEVMRPYLDAAAAAGRPGVVAVGVAQEFQRVITGYDRGRSDGQPGPPRYAFDKADRRVTCYYFYLWDDDFGPGFIKICSYFPYPVKVWVNGHEWAKRQATKRGIGFTELANGFASTDDPDGLQQVCDQLGPTDIQRFFNRWLAVVPTPLGATDRAAGYWWELSMRQVEVSRTLVLDQPRRARAFFEALISGNLGIGRPDEISLIFDRRIRSDTDTGFATRVVTRGVDVTINVFYKHSRIKQYLKEGRAIRTETVVNAPDDLGVARRLGHLDELQAKARAANRRLLDTERAGPGCVLASPAFARVAQPSGQAGCRTGALRFGDPRVMALAGALCIGLNQVVGFTHRSLRAQVTALLGQPYTANQMSYDLTRLRRKQLIRRLPGRNRYVLTPDGVRFAVFYTKVHDRLLVPLLAADAPPAPPALRHALQVIDQAVAGYVRNAHLEVEAA